MRILFCNYEYPPLGGGGGVVNAALAEELAKRHEVTILTSQGRDLPPESVEGGVRIVRVPVFFRGRQATASMASMLAFLPMGFLGGRRLLRQGTFDVLNTHFVLPSGPVGSALARAGQLPHVISLHGGDIYDISKWTSPHRHPVLRMWVRRLLRRADCVVANSRNTIENAKTYYLPELQAVRIPLGIQHPPQVEAGSRAAYGCGDDDVLLVTVGRLVARKGLPELLDLVEGLSDPKVKLLIMGSGPAEQPLKQAVRSKGLEEQILFLGRVSERDKFRVLLMSDVFVSTSHHEGFGIVFLEAMTARLPVVCYDHGGQTDFLEDGVTGHLVPL